MDNESYLDLTKKIADLCTQSEGAASPEILLSSFVPGLLSLLQVDRLQIFDLFETDGDYLVKDAKTFGSKQSHLSYGKILSKELTDGNIVCSSFAHALPQLFQNPPSINSFAYFPITASGKIIGLVGFENDQKTKSWDSTEIELLKIFTHQLASIIAKYLAKGQLYQQLAMQDLLISIASKYINIPLDQVPSAINESLRDMGEFVHADRAYIFEYDFATNTAKNTYEWCAPGIEPQIDQLQALSLDYVPFWLEKHKHGLPFMVDDVSELPDDGPGGIRDILEPQGIKSLITVPMGAGKEFIGAVGFDAVSTIHRYTETEQTILRLFAEMLVNIQMRQKSDIERKNIIKLIQSQNERLKNFAYIVSHNIRSHAANIDGLLAVLIDEIKELKENETVKVLLSVTKRLDETLRHLNKIVTLNTQSEQVTRLDLTEYISHTITDLSGLFKKANVQIRWEQSQPTLVLAVPEYLDSVLNNLLTNAVKYRQNESDDKIQITIENKKNQIALHIADNGLGIDLKKYSKDIFGMYKRFHPHIEGTGIGLFLTKNQVTAMGASIFVKSKPGKGSTFTVLFQKG